MTEGAFPLAMTDATPVQHPPPYRKGAPNVVVIVLDDLGFAQLGSYGSDIETPNLDRLADRGVRFSNFHTTAMCSPTRACLLTGRNSHRVGMGMLPDLPAAYPGYTGRFPDGAGTLAQVLSADGYATTCIGKWHLVARDERANGPYTMWPTGVGFDRYYGFLNGETNMWTPNLIRDQTHIEPPASPEEGYHLDQDLADEAIAQIKDHALHSPERPFFMWYATASPHAPHQAPTEWIDRYRGCFDTGWDAWREHSLARQIELGLMPADTELSARPPWIEPWDEIDEDRRRLYSRMMEVFAGFLSHADHHIGRVLDELDRQAMTENTVFVFLSDNGCSGEGGPNGTWNQLRHYISDLPDDMDLEQQHLEDLGGFKSSGHYPWGWAHAGNTPFRRWKRYTFEGGVRDPMIIAWPEAGDAAGTIRSQYCHVTDLMPTILDLVGLEPPAELGGVAQLSIDGVSLHETLTDPAAPDPRTEQYYELWGSRAIYRDGWKAVTNHVNQLSAAEREHLIGSHRFEDDEWELFDTRTDPTESHNLAAEMPDKVAELAERWLELAEQNQVLPIDDSRDNRIMHIHLPWAAFRGSYELRPGDKIHESNGPLLLGGFRMLASFPEAIGAGASGVLAEQGDWMCGWAFVVIDGEALWVLNHAGHEFRATGAVPADTRVLAADATVAEGGGFDLVLTADGVEIGSAHLPIWPAAFAPDGAFLTTGYGRPFPVCDDYEPPFEAPPTFAGLRIDIGEPPPLDLDAEIERLIRHQ